MLLSFDDAAARRWGIALTLVCAACGHDWEQFDPRLTGGAAAAGAGTGAVGGSGALGGAGATGGATGGDESGGGGAGASTTGGTGGVLSDDGVLVRYYLDEATSGTQPPSVIDAAPDPLALPIEYVGGMAYIEEGGHAGIHWPVAAIPGGAHLVIGDTKIMQLHGSPTGTIEAVARVEEVSPNGSRLMHIGFESGWSFSLGLSFEQPAPPEPPLSVAPPTRFITQGVTAGGGYDAHFTRRFDPQERFVVHVVLDTQEDIATERLRLYVDGVRLDPDVGGTPPTPGDTLMFLENESVAVGNRAIGDRSIVGTIFYGAYYTTPLDEATIAAHVAVLLADDDTP